LSLERPPKYHMGVLFGGVFSTLRNFSERKKLTCYASFLVLLLEGSASADPNAREFLEGEFGWWVKMAQQDLGWLVRSEDCSLKRDESSFLGPVGRIPAFWNFSKEQQLVCYDTFLLPLLMSMARSDDEFRRDFVERFMNWEREMRKLLGWLTWRLY